jgi:hypothetical protein
MNASQSIARRTGGGDGRDVVRLGDGIGNGGGTLAGPGIAGGGLAGSVGIFAAVAGATAGGGAGAASLADCTPTSRLSGSRAAIRSFSFLRVASIARSRPAWVINKMNGMSRTATKRNAKKPITVSIEIAGQRQGKIDRLRDRNTREKGCRGAVPSAFRLISAADTAATTLGASGERSDINEHHLVVNSTRSKDPLSRFGTL